MDKKNKKVLIIVLTSMLVCVLIIGLIYALLTATDNKNNQIRIGSLDIEIVDLDLKKNNTSTRTMMPGDIDIVSWTSSNVGTSTALTRHTIDVYWKDVEDVNALTEADASSLLTFYPSTLSDEEIMADFEGDGSKKISPIEVIPTEVTKQVDGKTVYGFRYKFLGSTLEGSVSQGVSDISSENISFKLLLNPNTSYLYQNKLIGVDVVTEGMQYTEEGSGTWTVTDSQGI